MNNQTLMPIVDLNDVFTDSFLVDETGNVSFLSLIGKDTAIQEFRARWSLPVTQGGLTDFQVETQDGLVRLNIGSPESLEFLSGRLNTNLFGSLIQVFVFKHLVQKPDNVNRKALQLFKGNAVNQDKLWTLIKTLSPLPLLDEWRELVIDLFKNKAWLKKQPGVGHISAYSISIPEDELAGLLKANIQVGALLAKADKKGRLVDPDKVILDPPKEQPTSKSSLEHEIFGEPVSTYTRANALADGVLVDVSQTSEAKEAGFVVPVALTRAVWDSYVEWPSDKGGQDEKGRLWDVLYMAHHAIKTSKSSSELRYKLYCVPRDSVTCDDAREVTLKLVSHPGDQGEHVITIMEPNES